MSVEPPGKVCVLSTRSIGPGIAFRFGQFVEVSILSDEARPPVRSWRALRNLRAERYEVGVRGSRLPVVEA